MKIARTPSQEKKFQQVVSEVRLALPAIDTLIDDIYFLEIPEYAKDMIIITGVTENNQEWSMTLRLSHNFSIFAEEEK